MNKDLIGIWMKNCSTVIHGESGGGRTYLPINIAVMLIAPTVNTTNSSIKS